MHFFTLLFSRHTFTNCHRHLLAINVAHCYETLNINIIHWLCCLCQLAMLFVNLVDIPSHCVTNLLTTMCIKMNDHSCCYACPHGLYVDKWMLCLIAHPLFVSTLPQPFLSCNWFKKALILWICWSSNQLLRIKLKCGLVCELTLRVNRYSNGQESPLCHQ